MHPHALVVASVHVVRRGALGEYLSIDGLCPEDPKATAAATATAAAMKTSTLGKFGSKLAHYAGAISVGAVIGFALAKTR